MNSLARWRDDRSVRIALLVVYYLIVQIALFAMYAYKDFATPAYIYQEF